MPKGEKVLEKATSPFQRILLAFRLTPVMTTCWVCPQSRLPLLWRAPTFTYSTPRAPWPMLATPANVDVQPHLPKEWSITQIHQLEGIIFSTTVICSGMYVSYQHGQLKSILRLDAEGKRKSIILGWEGSQAINIYLGLPCPSFLSCG